MIAPSRLLAGTRIIEMAALGPVPFGGMMLADMGADVIRVDRAAEAVSSSAYEGMDRSPINRGCRSIGLDLRSSEGLRIARVVDENGVAELDHRVSPSSQAAPKRMHLSLVNRSDVSVWEALQPPPDDGGR